MSKHNDGMFKKVVTDGLAKQHKDGIAQGAYAMCAVILEKASNDNNSLGDRLANIVKFCNVMMGKKGDA